MTIKHPAPRFDQVDEQVRAHDESRLIKVLLDPPVNDSAYYHWEQLRHRTPPAGYSHEEWWLKLKLQRSYAKRELPLTDANGNRFWFAYTDEVLRLSEEIGRRAGGLEYLTPHTGAGSTAKYLLQSLVEESITSSQLEGASTSRKRAKHMLEAGLAPQDTSDRMIVNNFIAMQEVKDRARDPLTPEWVLALHRTLTAGTLSDPGESGRLQTMDDVRVSVVDQRERVTHEPPPAEQLPARLEAVCEFANGSVDDLPYLSPVIRATITHFMFGYDHYFADGNGRTARTAFYWAMLHNGYHLAEHVAISRILRAAPAQYGMAYEYSEDDEGDLTYFILHQLRTFKRALDDFEIYVAEKIAQTRNISDLLRDASSTLNDRQILLIEWFVREEVVRVVAKEVSNRFSVSGQTARNDLKGLEALGLLTATAVRRPTVWTVPRDLSERLEHLR